MNIKQSLLIFSIVMVLIFACMGCISPQQNNSYSNLLENNINASENEYASNLSDASKNNINIFNNESINLSSIDYSSIHVLPSYNDTVSEWLETNASFVARIALNDSRAQEIVNSGGKILGVIYFCHPSPLKYSGQGCAPALIIKSGTSTYYFSVNESEKKVISLGIEQGQ